MRRTETPYRVAGLRTLAVAVLAAGLLLAGVAQAWATPAGPPKAPLRPPILVLDAGMGDAQTLIAHWLGIEQDVGADGQLRLLTAAAPAAWSDAAAPDIYVLASSSTSGTPATASIGPREIAWALDQLAVRHPIGRAVIVAYGATGVSARQYLEDVSDPKQSARADVVGLVEVGVPNAGLSLEAKYPSLDVWAPFASAAGLAPGDLVPRSPLLTSLDSARFPGVLKALVIDGAAGTLLDAQGDGVTTVPDSVLATGVAAGTVDYKTVKASQTQAWSIVNTWHQYTKSGGALHEAVDQQALTEIGLAPAYASNADVRFAVKTFYSTWFSATVPTTHISSRLVLDVSGSMLEGFGGGTKLDAAKNAASDFADSLAARQGLASAVPEDLGLVAFNTKADVKVSGTSDVPSIKSAISALRASDNTDIGQAIAVGVRSFAGAPKPADKIMVLLSDGLTNEGLEASKIISGPVADAKKAGIRIDTIALGSVKQSDADFLKHIASSSGGTFHNSKDRFELRRDFLRARYSSLGTLTVDVDVKAPMASPLTVATVAGDARLLEVGVLQEAKGGAWQLMRDGKPVAASDIKSATSAAGVLSISVASPTPGAYTLAESGGARGRAHVFAIVQADAFRIHGTAVNSSDDSMLLLLGAGVALLAGIGTTAGLSMAGRRRRAEASGTGAAEQQAESVADTPGPTMDEEGGE